MLLYWESAGVIVLLGVLGIAVFGECRSVGVLVSELNVAVLGECG